MQQALAKLRAAEGGPAWRDAVVDASTVLSLGLAALLETVRAGDPAPLEVPDESLLKARRYARVKVAEMQLYASGQVSAGLAARDLYGALRAPIDEARAAFRREFLTPEREIPDYLHEELVRALAQNDEAMLGPDYPGALNGSRLN